MTQRRKNGRDRHDPKLLLTREQIFEIEKRLSDDEPFATDEEVRAVFDRLTR
jgi:hypothetical protein